MTLPRVLLAALLLPLVAFANSARARLVVMHGFADYTSAVLWMQADGPGPVEVEVTPDGGGEVRRFVLDASDATDHVVTLRVPALRPGTRYRYRVGSAGEAREGMLATQRFARPGEEAPQLSIVIGSCHFVPYPDAAFPADRGGDYRIFDAIAAKAPDLMLWLGDNLYLQTPDFADPSAMARHYRDARAFEPMQRLLTSTAHLAIWDDHDYGPNDSDRSYVFKGETLKLFQRYWPNPSFGLPGVPGVFGWVHLGDVDLFLLDDRYYRHPNRYPDVPEKSMFGTQQFEWLKEALLYSRARIKIVANGNQLWNRVSRLEGLRRYPDEQKRLAQWLAEQDIDGVVFVSGDRHFGELLRIERTGTYPLYEFTSSPLTYRPIENPGAEERSNVDLVPGTLTTVRQFGMIRVSGPSNRRRIAFEAYDSDGRQLWRQEVAASELRHPRRRP